MNNFIFNLLSKQLNENDKRALLIDVNNGLYDKTEELLLTKLIENMDIKQLYLSCANEYLSSKKTCINCRFYKSEGYCDNSIMEQEYHTSFYPPKQITFYCDLIELKEIKELING